MAEFDEADEDDLIQASQEVESDDQLLSATQQIEDDMDEVEPKDTSDTQRFANPVSDSYLIELSKSCLPHNTARRNKWAVNTFNAWAIARNNKHAEGTINDKIKALEIMTKKELYQWMSKFICEVRKMDGSEYPPKSLLSLCMGIQGHLRVETKQPIDFLRSPHCELFRQVLDSRMKTIARQGGNQTRQAEVFTPQQEDSFWRSKLLGDHNPKVLLRTMVYLNGRNFALRSGAEHRSLRFTNSQITLNEDGETPFLRYREDSSKTNQGGLHHRRVTPKTATIYANECPERCHVRLYKLYMKMCPKTGRDAAFYLSPLVKPNDKVWFSRQAVGHNTLQKVIPDMAKEAGLTGHYTNHSLRATAATTLFRAGVDEQLIMAQTGHRTHSGVRTYKRVHEDQTKEVSRVLNGAKRVNPTPVTDQTDQQPDQQPDRGTGSTRAVTPNVLHLCELQRYFLKQIKIRCGFFVIIFRRYECGKLND